MRADEVAEMASGLVTRRFLRRLIGSGFVDEPCAELIERALAKTRPHSHSGWVLNLALALDAPRELADCAASTCELFNATIDVLDDIQDNDTSYFADLSPSIQVNTIAQMLMLCGISASELEAKRPHSPPQGLTSHLLALVSAMICGQRIELTRENWSLDTYERMTYLMAGRQFEIYLRIATYAAAADVTPYLDLTDPLGLLLQMRHDRVSGDPRLMGLPAQEVMASRGKHSTALLAAADALPMPARPTLAHLTKFALED